MTPDTLAPLARILLRWVGGYLIARGMDASLFSSPEMISLTGAALCFVLSEGWYWLAKKFGWKT